MVVGLSSASFLTLSGRALSLETTGAIEVTGEPPLMDTTSTVTGINVSADELYRRLGIGVSF